MTWICSSVPTAGQLAISQQPRDTNAAADGNVTFTVGVSGGKAPWGIGGFGQAPKISVDWYRKAENQPYMFSRATLFGAGERNDEILYGRKQLLEDIASVNGGQIVINLNYDAGTDAQEMVADIARGLKRYRMAGVF